MCKSFRSRPYDLNKVAKTKQKSMKTSMTTLCMQSNFSKSLWVHLCIWFGKNGKLLKWVIELCSDITSLNFRIYSNKLKHPIYVFCLPSNYNATTHENCECVNNTSIVGCQFNLTTCEVITFFDIFLCHILYFALSMFYTHCVCFCCKLYLQDSMVKRC